MVGTSFRLKISGHGGQGVKFLAEILAKFLIAKGFYVSYSLLYDAAMRGGQIEMEMIVNKTNDRIFFTDEYDLYVTMGKKRELRQKKARVFLGQDEPIFKKADRSFSLNMIVLGIILKILAVSLEKIERYLPEKNKANNLKATSFGYQNYES